MRSRLLGLAHRQRSCNKGPIHLLGTLRECGWIVTDAKTIRPLPSSIIKRYPSLPSEVIAAICSADSCVASDDKSWLLCLPDFSEESESAFRWNEFELMSLEAAAGDDAWLKNHQDILGFALSNLDVGSGRV